MSETNDFRGWMDARGLKAEDVASKFDVSPQTISHWRSQGVPERRRSHVHYIMSCWQQAPEPPSPAVLQQLVISPTRDQFRLWNQAALDARKLIEDWAIEGLDQIAAEAAAKSAAKRPALTSLKVAEEPPSYGNGTEGK